MAWSPMGDVPNPIFDTNGDPYSGAVLKAYLPGTTTSTSIAIDKNGGSPQTSISANADGVWEVSGNEVVPHIDREHKWGIFANSSDATANTPFYMGPFDNIDPRSTNIIYNSSSTVSQRLDNLDVLTYAAMRALTSSQLTDGDTIRVTDTDKGGVFAVKTGTVTDDGLNLIVFTDDSARYAERIDTMGVFRSVKYYGAVGDGATDDTAAIQAAIDALEAETYGGTVLLPPGTYRITSALDLSTRNVSIKGAGCESSTIDCLSCGGITFTSASADNKTTYLEDFALQGASGSTANHIAIESLIPSGGTPGTDNRDGIYINRLKIYDWDKGINLSDTWESEITSCNFEKVNVPIDFNERCLVWRVMNNRMVFNTGDSHGGTSTETCININGVSTEGIYIFGNQLYGYPTAITMTVGLHVEIIFNDIFATSYGILTNTPSTNLIVRDNYILTDTDDAIGYYAPGIGSEFFGHVVIDGNNFQNATGTSGTQGIQLNDSGNTNQYNYRITNNTFFNQTSYDIRIFNGGYTDIYGNRSESTSVTNSISVTESVAGTVRVGNNRAASGITSSGGTDVSNDRGTFTPELADAPAGGNVASATASGYYMKDCDAVTIVMKIESIDTTGLAGGNTAYIRGFPFDARSGTTQMFSVVTSSLTLSGDPSVQIAAGTGTVNWQASGAALGGPMTVSQITSGSSSLYLSCTYITG